MASTNIALSFNVRRKTPELIPPAKPTPHELRALSDIDDQEGFRFLLSGLIIYRHNPFMEGIDIPKIIRRGLAKALVFYYPLAGRLREYATGKLAVECTGEGVVLVDANADVMLQQFGDDALHPPFPNVEEFLVPDTLGFLNSPLLLIQVLSSLHINL